MIGQNVNLQMAAKDELIMQLQRQLEVWKNKYDALAKLYSQLRGEHLDLLNRSKGFQLKANSAQEAIDKMERMERDVKTKNLELADMIRERDRARYDLDRLKSVRGASPSSRYCLADSPFLGRVIERKLTGSSATWHSRTSERRTLLETRALKSHICFRSITGS
jgi:hypothetical protein